jgi:hypothetical protein
MCGCRRYAYTWVIHVMHVIHIVMVIVVVVIHVVVILAVIKVIQIIGIILRIIAYTNIRANQKGGTNMLKIEYIFYPFGKKEFAEVDMITFDSFREYEYWQFDRKHDKTWRNIQILGEKWS